MFFSVLIVIILQRGRLHAHIMDTSTSDNTKQHGFIKAEQTSEISRKTSTLVIGEGDFPDDLLEFASPVSIFSCASNLSISSIFDMHIGKVLFRCHFFQDLKERFKELRALPKSATVHIFSPKKENFEANARYLGLFRLNDKAILHLRNGQSFKLTQPNGELTWKELEDNPSQLVLNPPLNLQGQELRVSVMYDSPWMIINEEDTVANARLTFNNLKNRTVRQTEVLDAAGIEMEILKTLSRHTNFSYRMFVSSDGKWGTLGPGGVFSGMIGDVQSGLADVAVSEITITWSRSTVTQFTVPYYYDVTRFFTQKPNPTRVLSTVLFLNIWVWIAIVLSFVLCSVMVWMAAKYSGDSSGELEFSYALLMSIRVMVEQSLPHTKVGMGGQFVLGTFMMATLVITTTYGGMMVSFLTSSTTHPPTLNTLNDLSEAVGAGHFKITMLNDTSTYFLFKSRVKQLPSGGHILQFRGKRELTGFCTRDSDHLCFKFEFQNAKPNTTYGKIYKGVTNSDYDDNMEGLMRIMADPNLAYINQQLNSEVRMGAMGRYKFHVSEEKFYPNYFAMALRLGSPYLEAFNTRINEFQCSGLLQKWVRQWTSVVMKPNGTDTLEAFESWKPLSLDSMQGAFYILLLGLGCGCLTFFIEMSANVVSNCLSWKNSYVG